ncbi:NHL repeat-containing protein [Candidatus Latescibacterota bacterium]
MKRFFPIALLFIYMFCSCSGTIDKGKLSGEMTVPEPQSTPPVISGDIQLTYVESFGKTAGIVSPWGISFGVDGTLYVCDRDRSSIIRLDREGTGVSRFTGSGSRTERLYSPVDVCSTGGLAIYAVDAANSRVLRFDRNLKHSYVLYKKDSRENRLFSSFNGLAFNKTTGDLFVTDRDTGAIIRIDMLGGTIKSMGAFGSGKESLHEPAGLDVGDDGTIFIADKGAGAVAILRHFGAEIRYIGSKVLESPVDVAAITDSTVAVACKNGVLVLTTSGIAVGIAGYGTDRTMSPRSVAYREGKLFISDGVSGSILVYTIE